MKSPDLTFPVPDPTSAAGRPGWVAHGHRLALLLGFVLAVVPAADVRAQLRVGDPLPSLADFALEGDLAAAPTAGRVVVLDFWASWCAPCKASFPMLGALQREWGGEGVTVLGVSVDEKKSAYEAFLARLQPPFVTVRDAQQRLVQRVRVPKMPTTYLIDRKGVVRFVHEGFQGEPTERALRAHVRQLLDEPR
jgi:thiol-disulfide isomerase/thioredoxin